MHGKLEDVVVHRCAWDSAGGVIGLAEEAHSRSFRYQEAWFATQQAEMCMTVGQHQVSGGIRDRWLPVEARCMFQGARCVFSSLHLHWNPFSGRRSSRPQDYRKRYFGLKRLRQ